jgi:hypothetical protein
VDLGPDLGQRLDSHVFSTNVLCDVGQDRERGEYEWHVFITFRVRAVVSCAIGAGCQASRKRQCETGQPQSPHPGTPL